MASLTNTKIKNTYVSLLKVADNGQLDAALQDITDGAGNTTGIQLNTNGDLTASGTVAFGSLKDSGENITITKFVDAADGIGSNNNDTTIPTSAAVSAYVASQVTLEDLDFAGDSGTGAVDLDSQTLSIVGTANEITTAAGAQTLTIGLPSTIHVNVQGDLTGNVTATSVLVDGVTATTQLTSDNSTKVATTAFVKSVVTAENLDIAGTSGTGSVDLDSQVLTIAGTTNEIETNASGQTITVGLPSDVIIGNDLTVTTDASVGGTLDVTGATGIDGNFDIATNKFTVQAATGNTAVAGTLGVTGTSTLGVINASGLASLDGGIDVDGAFTVSDTTGNIQTSGTLGVTGTTSLTDDLAVDTDTLFVDASADRVGINKNNPAVALDVVGDITSSATITGSTITGTTVSGTTLTGTLSTAAQTNITSVGTLSSLTVSGDLTVDTSTLKVDSANNRVGIGTASPTHLLQLYAASLPELRLGDATTQIQMFTNTDAFFGTVGSHNLIFRTAATERLRIDASGNLGLGTSSPSQKLQIVGGNFQLDDDNAIQWGGSNNFIIGSEASNYLRMYTNGAERMRINSSGNVGIGVSPTVALDILATDGTIKLQSSTGTNFTSIRTINTGGTLYQGIERSTGGVLGLTAAYEAFLLYDANNPMLIGTGNSHLRFSTNGSERLRILAGGGLTFNGDTAAANALDDYEEGDWAPTLSFNYGTTGITYSTQLGHYTKIGRQVTVTGFCVLTNKGSDSGIALISGLPFTIGNNQRNYSVPSFNLNNVTFANQHQGYGIIGSTSILMTETTEAGVSNALDDSNFANNSDFIISFTYFV